ncbi:MAG: aminopeptidase [Anaerolineae bacterium]|nr:aminopeptidase [Anaerolineae bacterium]
MARVLVNYSTQVKPGDRVLFRGTSPLAQPLMQALTAEALKAGGIVSNYVHMSGEDRIFLENGSDAQLEAVNPMLKLMYDTADVIIRIEAEEDTAALAGFPTAKAQARARAYGGLLSVQMARESDGTLRRCTTLFPTEAYARDAGMSVAEYEDFVYGACMVDQPDPVAHWNAVHAQQQRLVDFLKGRKLLQVRGANIDLSMSIEGRTFENASGRVNFPDGEIFTGPVEASVNGWVQFTFPAIYRGNVVRGARLEFRDGVVVKATADENEAFLNAMLDTDAGARRLGEFAIGTNTGIDRFTGQILFDEKIGGTVHMALGKGYPFTGSVNDSAIHWDMICDMRGGGDILVDGQRFYENGDFVVG